MADALTHARDVLRMVAIGIQQHHITARDVEFLYDDGPKRVSVHRLAVESMRGLEQEIAARGVLGTTALGHEDDILALCERLETDDMRDVDPATAAATIRSLCQQLDATRGAKAPAPTLRHNQHLCADCTTENACQNRLDLPRPCWGTAGVDSSRADQVKGGA